MLGLPSFRKIDIELSCFFYPLHILSLCFLFFRVQINNILCISEPYYTQILDIHGDQNENERIDTDTTETQQWKVSECLYNNLNR